MRESLAAACMYRIRAVACSVVSQMTVFGFSQGRRRLQWHLTGFRVSAATASDGEGDDL